MNILYLTNHLNIGGISSYVLTLAKGMKARGHAVYLASSAGEIAERLNQAGVPFLPIPIKTKSEANLPKILGSCFMALRYIKEKDIDIVHSNTRVTSVLGSLLENFSHTPHISTCHGFFKQRLSRRIFPCWGRKVIAVSRQVQEHLVSDFRLRQEDIRVIPNGIELSRFKVYTLEFKEEAKKNLGLGPGPVVGIVARLSDVKGHVYLIEAMKSVLEKTGDAQLLIVGNGNMKKELLNLTRRLGIEKSVFFMPAVWDTAKILPIMDLFVLPSLKEGLGLSLMEAMASGLAVVASDVGGIKGLIKHGQTGLLVQPADSLSLASAISGLLKDKVKAQSLGDNARSFINESFSQEAMVLETERVYLECVNTKY
jgi:glycosyltransferase involved in cell wall biosynthesis